MSRGRLLRLVGLGAATVVAVALIHPGPYSTRAQAPAEGVAILQRLRAAADAGDDRARAALRDFEGFAASRGLTLDTAAEGATHIRELLSVPGLEVGAQGITPFFLRVDAHRSFSDRTDIRGYIAQRMLALTTLAAQDPGRSVLVQVSFERRPNLNDLLPLLARHSGEVEEIHVDAVADGTRLLTYGSRDEAARQMASRNPLDVTAEVRANLSGAGLEECGASPGTVDLVVKFLRVRLPAGESVQLASEPEILSVDPLTDVTDQFTGRAVRVNVGAWPSLTEAWEAVEGRQVAERPCTGVK